VGGGGREWRVEEKWGGKEGEERGRVRELLSKFDVGRGRGAGRMLEEGRIKGREVWVEDGAGGSGRGGMRG